MLSGADARGLAVCDPYDEKYSEKCNDNLRVNCVYGDLKRLATLRKIDSWVQVNGKADLLMSRGGGGLNSISAQRWKNIVYLRRIHQWLTPEGLALLMIPDSQKLLRIGYPEPAENSITELMMRIGFRNIACSLDYHSEALIGPYSVVALQK